MRSLPRLLFASLAISLLLIAAGCKSRGRGSRLERPIPEGDGGQIEVDGGTRLPPEEDDAGIVIDPDAGEEMPPERDAAMPPERDAGSFCGSLTDCGGICVDTYSDPEHCGGCFFFCGVDAACVGGICEATCTPSCSGRSCGDDGCGGSCGTCSSGYTCSAGSCVPDGPTSAGESCSSPTVVSASGGARTFTFTGRTANHTPFSCGSTSGQPDVVFSFTPSRSGSATFAAAGPTSSTDVVLAVYSSPSCTSSYEVACNDDEASGVYSSRATVTVSAFSTYYVAVAPYGSSVPSDTITLTVTAP